MTNSLYIGIPTMEWVHAGLANWLARFCGREGGKRRIEVDFTINYQPVEIARNAIVKRFLESGCDCLLFIDSDIVPPDDIEPLFETFDRGAEVVGAACPIFDQERGVRWNVQLFNEIQFCTELPPCPMPVHSVGMGLTLIARRLFEKLKQPYFDRILAPNGEAKAMGEDVYFCRKALEAGFAVYVDPRVIGAHYKMFNLAQLKRV